MCMIDACDERFKVFEKTPIRHARKVHHCHECDRTIQIGEPYLYMRSLGEDGWYTNRACAHCQVAIEWITVNCGGVVLGCVRDDIQEHAEEYMRWDMLRLAVSMDKRWSYKSGKLMQVPVVPKRLEVSAKPRRGGGG
jgi:hypothetical protein